MTLVNKLMVPVLALGIGSGLAGCSKKDNLNDIKLGVMNENRLTEDAVDWLKARIVNIDSAKAYDRRFLPEIDDIQILFDRGIMPGVANRYERRFSAMAIPFLDEKGITPEIANAYDPEFDADQIINLHGRVISPEMANRYSRGVFSTNAIAIMRAYNVGLDYKMALSYHRNFSADERIDLYVKGVSPETANSYHESLSGYDIIKLHDRIEGISPKIANRYIRLNNLYGARITAEDIIGFVSNKIPYHTVKRRAKQLMIDKSITE